MAALTAVSLPLATSLLDYAYDYHVDTLLLALFLGGVWAMHRGRGWLAGVLVALTVTLKPTCLMWVPCLALIATGPQSELDRRGLGRAMLGGAAVLLAWGALNTYLFGRPYWAGYNRTLVRVAGEPQIADHVDAFGTPLRAGLTRLFNGAYGLSHRFTLFAAGAVGTLALLRRAPRYALGALSALGFAVLVFGKYQWEGDRFVWPALALLAPGLAYAMGGLLRAARGLADAISRVVRAAPESDEGRAPGGVRVGSVAGLVAIGVGVALLALTPRYRPRSEDVLESAYALGATQLASSLSLDVRDSLSPARRAELTEGEASQIARNRYGAEVPRVAPAAALLASPFALGGWRGLVLLHIALLALLIFAWTMISPRPIAVVGATALAFVCLPNVATDIYLGGGGLLGAAAFAISARLARTDRVVGSAVFASLAFLFTESLALLIAGAALVALVTPPLRRRLGLSLGVGLLVVMAVQLAYWGRPLGTADDFVVVSHLPGAFRVVTSAPLFGALSLDGAGATLARTLWPLVVVAAGGVRADRPR